MSSRWKAFRAVLPAADRWKACRPTKQSAAASRVSGIPARRRNFGDVSSRVREGNACQQMLLTGSASHLSSPPGVAAPACQLPRSFSATAPYSTSIRQGQCSGPSSPPPALLRRDSWHSDRCPGGDSRRFSSTMGGAHVATPQFASWGNGDFGRLGLANSLSADSPTICESLRGHVARQVACGGAHTLFLTAEGRVFAAGLNDCGQLAAPSLCSHSAVPLEVRGLPAAARWLAAGHFHSACITEDGELFTWGSNSCGQLGLGSGASKVYEARQVAALRGTRVVQVALGAEHSLAVTEEGALLAWGSGLNGRLGHGPAPLFHRLLGRTSEPMPRLVASLRDIKVTGVAAGHQHSACIDAAGRLYTFGYGRFWQLGLGAERDEFVARQVADLPGGAAHVACGGSHTAVATLNGDVFTWGSNESSCLGLGRGDQSYIGSPVKVDGELAPLSVHQVACGWKHTVALTAGGQMFAWGWGGSQGSHSMEGNSSGGQLGLGNEFDYLEPTHVCHGALGPRQYRGTGPLHVVQVSCGFNHTAAVLA